MALDRLDKIDAIGTEAAANNVVLSIVDGCDWSDLHSHLLALQSKINAYFDFIDGGQLYTSYPAAVGRGIVIDVVTRFPLPLEAIQLLKKAAESGADIISEIRTRHIPEGTEWCSGVPH